MRPVLALLLLTASCGPETPDAEPIAATARESSGAAPLAGPAANQVLSGVITDEDIVDGDTFDLSGTRIRPLGYDSPERGKVCRSDEQTINVYREATQALRTFALGKLMTCTDTGERDRDGRTVAACRVGADDLGEHMVSVGWARDWPRYSHGAYCEAERQARADKRGLWALACPDDAWDGRDYVNAATGSEC